MKLVPLKLLKWATKTKYQILGTVHKDVHVAMQTTKIASLLADIYSETCENSLLGMNSLEDKVSLLKRTLGSFVCVLPI